VAVWDLLAQHGVPVEDRQAVFALLRALPLAPRARVEAWAEYLARRGETMTDAERDALQS
jgi:hypothetical protein